MLDKLETTLEKNFDRIPAWFATLGFCGCCFLIGWGI